jgi:hypothetical protein
VSEDTRKPEDMPTSALIAALMDYDNCHDGLVDEAARRLRHLADICDGIPELVARVAGDCGVPYANQPSLSRRGEKIWRYHRVRAGNNWSDAGTPLVAAIKVAEQISVVLPSDVARCNGKIYANPVCDCPQRSKCLRYLSPPNQSEPDTQRYVMVAGDDQVNNCSAFVPEGNNDEH